MQLTRASSARRHALAFTLALASAHASRTARADPTRAVCASAYEQGQRLRHAGKLLAAREKLLLCARPECPAAAQDDCARWLGEVERSLPSIVVRAKDAEGRDTDAARLAVDDVPVADKLDGRALPLDPGAHVIRVEAAGRALAARVVLAEGEQGRPVSFAFPRVGPRLTSTRVVSAAPSPTPAAVYVFAGVSLAALGSFTAFAVAGKRAEECVPQCSQAEVDTFRRHYLVADLSLVAGVLSGAAMVWLALRPRPAASPAAAKAARVELGLSPRGGVELRTAF